MRVPKYWIQGEFNGVDRYGQPMVYTAWGWSDTSEAEARAMGNERARMGYLRTTTKHNPTDQYDLYMSTPMREETVEHIGPADDLAGVITRCRYGALVLNAARVLFVDVDLPYPRLGFWAQFSKRKREEEKQQRQLATVDRIMTWALANPQHSFRLYMTANGYRLLFTDALYDPNSDRVQAIFDGLDCDDLYRKLTRKQECFRARLTPKPWRMNLVVFNMGTHWDWPELEDQRRQWIAEYDKKCAQFQSCNLIEVIGNAEITTPEIESICTLHDARCGVGGTLPLA